MALEVGTIHSDQLRVTERYTRDSFDTIRYEVTMEDPVVFTKPWHMYEVFRLRQNERIREYECIENNEDIVRFEKLLQQDPIYRTAQPKPLRCPPSSARGLRVVGADYPHEAQSNLPINLLDTSCVASYVGGAP